MARTLPALLIALFALLACKLPGRGNSAGAGSAASGAASAAAAPIEQVVHSDGSIRAPKPSGDGWNCREQTASQDGSTARLVKCSRTAEGEFFFMVAKKYSVPESEVMAPEALFDGPYRRSYEKLFESFTIESRGPVEQQGKRWYEVQIKAEHAAKGSITKTERVLTKGVDVYLLSAEGSPKDFARFAAEREAWMSKAEFTEL
jgi:hypothetical protein